MRLIGFAVVLALTAILAPLAAEQQGGGCTGLAFCKGGRTTGGPGKSSDGERVADGSGVATKRGNARGAKGPCCSAIPPTTREAGAA